MPVPERFIKQFGSLENVPEYIVTYYKNRDELEEQRKQEAREAAERQERERERIKALRRPPTNVRLHPIFDGRKAKIKWEPPETADELPPAGYWVSEERNGEWTAHGDYVLPHVREAVLFGTGPARVETWYHQMALYESYPSVTVSLPTKPPEMGSAAEGVTEETSPFAAGLSRMERIVAAVRSYSGRRTRDGRPWVRFLRRYAEMPDIRTGERDEAYKISTGKG